MRRLVLLLLLAGLVLAASAQAQNIYLTTHTSLVSRAQLRDALPAFQAATADFRRWWGGEPTTLSLFPSAGAWQISISEGSFLDPGGYHFLGPDGTPYGRVFAANGNWQLTLTHELFEMLADPYLTRTVQSDRLYLVEVCDPVESGRFAYYRRAASGKRVTISDFVGPEWYSSGRYFDYRRHVKKAHQILADGYASYWNGYDWASLFG